MLWIANAELAAAVSNAGGLGIISPLAGMEMGGDPAKTLELQIEKAKSMTERPFGVNIPLDLTYAGALIDVVVTHGVGIVVTGAGNPGHYSEFLGEVGVKVLHVVSSVRQARNAESSKVAAVIAEGVEAGGHDGFDELPLFSLVPSVVDSVTVPVIAAGGIVDARGMVAALSLGAEGVQMGTRFLAVEECISHSNFKQAILEATDTSTVITCRKLFPARSLKTAFSKALLELEASGATAEDIHKFLGYGRPRTAQIEGDLDNGEAYCGASAGLIKEIIPAAEVIRRLVEGYQDILGSL
jgi:enoyl-[acyl-carrier protein] reductase II